MGRVTDHLVSLINRQVHENGIVVWYDPDRVYAGVAQSLSLPGAEVLRFQASFFELREGIEPFLEFVGPDGRLRADAALPPRLVVYVPMEHCETRYALIEAEAAGAVMEPGASALPRNTRLSVVARQVFKEAAPDQVDEIVRQVETAIYTLEDLDRIHDDLRGATSGLVKLIFRTASAAEIALLLASSEAYDASIQTKQALPELENLLRVELGIEIDPNASLDAVRSVLRRALLLSDLLASLPPDSAPNELATAPLPVRSAHREAVQQICQTWRNRTDHRQTYVEAARAVDVEAGVAAFDLPPRSLLQVETFPSIEEKLLAHAEQRLLDGAPQEALALAERRKCSFWAAQVPTNQLRWSLLETAARLLVTALRIKAELKTVTKSPLAMVNAYTEGSEPWCLLDTYQRHLERQYTTFDLEIGGEHDRLEQVIHHARRQYTEVAGLCAEAFTATLEAADFKVVEILTQQRIFPTLVAPRRNDSGKVAYVWVDAMRYEMGREFLEGLEDRFEICLAPGIAQLPTITDVGMSALLPGADQGAELVEAAASKVAIRSGPTLLKDRPARVKYLREVLDGGMVELKLNDLLKPSKKLQDAIAEADFVLVTSQEIDRRGEEAEDEDEARRYMDEVLDKLRKGIRRLASLGVAHFVITADHGHLFGGAIESGMKIDPPGGKTVDLHRRVWIGHGGSAAGSYVRVPASRIGLGGGLELAFPRGLACFKVKGGSTSFFHGGASLQEMVIPVAVVTARQVAPHAAGTPVIQIVMEKPRITTRFFSVTATYTMDGLFGADEKRTKFVVRVGKKEIGAAAMAAYGFEDGTQEIVLQKDRPNAVTLMLTVETDARSVSVHVLDAATQVELKRLENIPVAIAM